jgi:hypothetical protein
MDPKTARVLQALITAFDGDTITSSPDFELAKEKLDTIIGCIGKLGLGASTASGAVKATEELVNFFTEATTKALETVEHGLTLAGAAVSIVSGGAAMLGSALYALKQLAAIKETEKIADLLAPQIEAMSSSISEDALKFRITSPLEDIRWILETKEETAIITLAHHALEYPTWYTEAQLAAIMGKLHPTNGVNPLSNLAARAREAIREVVGKSAEIIHRDSPDLLMALSAILGQRLKDLEGVDHDRLDQLARSDCHRLLIHKVLQLSSLIRITCSNEKQLEGEYLRFIGGAVGFSLGILTTGLAIGVTMGAATPTAISLISTISTIGKTVVGLFATDAHRLPQVARIAGRADIFAATTDISGGMPILATTRIIDEYLVNLAERLNRLHTAIKTADFSADYPEEEEEAKRRYLEQAHVIYNKLLSVPGTMYIDLMQDPNKIKPILDTLITLNNELQELERPFFGILERMRKDESTSPSLLEMTEEQKKVLNWFRTYEPTGLTVRHDVYPLLLNAENKTFVHRQVLTIMLDQLLESPDNKKLCELMRVYKEHKSHARAWHEFSSKPIREEIKPYLDILANYRFAQATCIADLVEFERALKAGHAFLAMSAHNPKYKDQTIEQKYTALAERYPRHPLGADAGAFVEHYADGTLVPGGAVMYTKTEVPGARARAYIEQGFGGAQHRAPGERSETPPPGPYTGSAGLPVLFSRRMVATPPLGGTTPIVTDQSLKVQHAEDDPPPPPPTGTDSDSDEDDPPPPPPTGTDSDSDEDDPPPPPPTGTDSDDDYSPPSTPRGP